MNKKGLPCLAAPSFRIWFDYRLRSSNAAAAIDSLYAVMVVVVVMVPMPVIRQVGVGRTEITGEIFISKPLSSIIAVR